MLYKFVEGEMVNSEDKKFNINETFLSDHYNNFSILANPDFDDKHYFSFYNNANPDNATKISKIMYEDAKYIESSKQLTLKQKRDLIDILESPVPDHLLNNIKNEDLKNEITDCWKYLIYCHNKTTGISDDEFAEKYIGKYTVEAYEVPDGMISIYSTMPNFTRL